VNPIALAVLVVLALFAGSVVFVVYQIVRQQGRMLLRIDDLERALATALHPGSAVPVGPPLGSAVEPFLFSGLDGAEHGLSDLRGNPTLLVNWSVTCGFCDMIAPDLADLRPELERAGIALVLLSRGDAATNRESADRHDLGRCLYLLGPDANPAGFQGLGTPSAILVDEQGKVASPLAVGAENVPALARQLADPGVENAADAGKLRGMRPVSESRLVRDGLKAGSAAPAFSLPDLHGNQVSLDAYRGRRLLLTFSDPHCGPCDALAPHLARIHREHEGNNLAVVLVSRGEVDENRRKADEHGLPFPVVLQDGWSLSRRYGIFATPVAFLIDEQGTITADVARGVDEIVALVAADPGR
jgi:peroxiredoxin